MQGSDLRAPQNLAQQLQSQKGITEEAGRNLLSIFQVSAINHAAVLSLCLEQCEMKCRPCREQQCDALLLCQNFMERSSQMCMGSRRACWPADLHVAVQEESAASRLAPVARNR